MRVLFRRVHLELLRRSYLLHAPPLPARVPLLRARTALTPRVLTRPCSSTRPCCLARPLPSCVYCRPSVRKFLPYFPRGGPSSHSAPPRGASGFLSVFSSPLSVFSPSRLPHSCVSCPSTTPEQALGSAPSSPLLLVLSNEGAGVAQELYQGLDSCRASWATGALFHTVPCFIRRLTRVVPPCRPLI